MGAKELSSGTALLRGKMNDAQFDPSLLRRSFLAYRVEHDGSRVNCYGGIKGKITTSD